MRTRTTVLSGLLLLLMIQNVYLQDAPAPACPLRFFYDGDRSTCLPCEKANSTQCTAQCTDFEVVNATLCLLKPTCIQGFYNTTTSPFECKQCQLTNITDECALCPSFQFNDTSSKCELKKICNDTFYWDTTKNQCVDCTTVASSDNCQKTYACPFFYFNETFCNPCSAIEFTDPNGKAYSNAQCPCQTGYYWNASQKICSPCIGADEIACYICKGFFYNSDSKICRTCESIPSSFQKYNDQIGGCQCYSGYAWNYKTFSCSLCSLTTDELACKHETCAGFVYSGSKCVECALDDNADPALNTVFFGNVSCGCKNSFIWDSTNNNCSQCQGSTITQTCGTGTCSDFIFIQNCTSQCSGVKVDNKSTVVNGTCGCELNYVWINGECKICFEAKTQEQCSKDSCSRFWWDATTSQCISCKSIENIVQPADPTDQTNYLIEEKCTCEPDFEFNIYTKKCVSCYNSDPNGCGYGKCSKYYFGVKSCKKCPIDALDRNGKTPPNACQCNSTQAKVWTGITAKCMECNFTNGFSMDNSTGKCIDCKADPYVIPYSQTNISKISTNYSCKCRANYQFINGKCSCNSTALLFDIGGAGCGNCSVIAGGVSYNKAILGCNCIVGTYWVANKKICICNDTANYLVSNRCTPCKNLGGGLTLGVNQSYPTTCACASTLIWSPIYKTCVCKQPNSIWNSNNLICQICDETTHFSNKSKVTATSCGCNENMIWDSAKFICICNTKSIKDGASNIKCKVCNTVGTTGNKTSQQACGCKSGWKWNATLLQCGCNTTNCICPTNSILYKQFCVPCSKQTVRSTGISTNNTACECKKSFYWNQTEQNCNCNITKAIYSSLKNICNTCDIYFNANITTSSIKNFNCTCVPNYVWNPSTLTCQFSFTPLKKILTLAGTFLNCTLGQLDNYNCKCNSGQIWNDYTNACMNCSTIPYVNQTASATVLKYFCICNTGYFWDVISLSCKPGCKLAITDARCTYCLKHAGVKINSAFQSISATEKLWMGSGDVQFAQALGTASPMYKLYSNIKCVCNTGYTWNSARKRCFKATANATY